MKYADLVPIVSFDAIGAPAPRAAYAVAQAAHEFFRLTRTYVVEMDPAKLIANSTTFDLDLPSNTLLVEVNQVKYGSQVVESKLPEQLPGGWEDLTGSPSFYLVQGSALRLVPYPIAKSDTLMRAKFAVHPMLTASEIPDDLGDKFRDALINGAKGFLLADVGKPWTNPGAAAAFRAEYMRTVNEQRILERKGGSRTTSLQVRMRRV